MNATTRRRALWLITLALILIAADTTVWLIAERRLANGLASVEADAAAAGYRLEQGSIERSGWPVAAILKLERPRAASGDVAWTADRVDLSLVPWAPRRLTIGVIGNQTIAAPNAALLRGAAESMAFIVPLEPDPAIPAVTLTARSLRLWQGAPDDAAVVHSLTGQVDGFGPDRNLLLDATATDIALPPSVRAALGPRVEQVNISGDILRVVPSRPAAPGATLAAQAAAWRDRGGTVDLRHFAIAWDQLRVTGSSRIALDRDLQPALSGTAKFEGLDPTITRLAASGAMPEREAQAARAVLALIASPAAAPSTGPGATTLEFGVSGQVLSIEGLPVARLPPLVWPQS